MGHYVIVAELGSGTLGRVHGAEDLKTTCKVALRVFAPELSVSDPADACAHFIRAAHEAERLNHPNIVSVYEVGTFAGGTPYIATELLIGLTLRESIDGGIALPLHKVIDVAMLILRGLDYAHQQGVVHRDLKPANIMLAHNGMVKIMDFAIALAAIGGKTPAIAMPGSHAYRAPEHLSPGTLDARSDLFALGVILYEMLAGKHPFAADSDPRVAQDIAHRDPPSPATLNPSIPPALDRIVMQAIAKDPAARFATAREMSHALAPICTQLKDSRSPPPAHETTAGVAGGVAAPSAAAPATPTASKGRRVSVLAGAAVLAGILVLSQVMNSREEAESDRPAALPSVAVTPSGDDSIAAVSATAAAGVPLSTTVAAGGAEPVAPRTVSAPAAAEPELQPLTPIEARPAPSAATHPAPTPSSATASGSKTAIQAPGTLGLAVLPWGEVYVDGRRRGVTPPLRELALPPGTHRIEIRNADFPPYVQKLTIKSGKSISIRHRFQ